VTTDALEYDENEDEQAHTALLTSAAGAGSSLDDDGDGWMNQLGDDTAFLADTMEPCSRSSPTTT
jgi:hypothetical protein